jgi:translocation and assembly module TamA
MVRVFPRVSACSLAAAAFFLMIAPVGWAQEAPDPAGALDPASPMAPLPDLGVEWPDLSTESETPPADATAPGVTPSVDATEERRYRVVLEGVESRIQSRFDELSALVQGDDDEANVAQINRRARQDETLLADLMRAHGYYAATVVTRVEPEAGGRILVTLRVDPGPVYSFAEVSLPGVEKAGDKEAALRKAFGVEPRDPVDAEKVNSGVTALKVELGRQGFPFPTVGEPQVTIDHDQRTASLTLAVDPDGAKRFGAIRPVGKRLFSAKHLGRIARFRPGEPYDAAMIDDFRRALIATGLVSSVEIKPVQSAAPDVVDIDVKLERAPPRTIAGEIGYGTGEGIRAEVSWTHRNLIKPEGAVTFRGVAGTQEQLLGASLRRNNFKARDRVLTAQILASHTDRKAYDARTFTIGAGLERQTNIIWQKKWTWSYGVDLTASDERDVIAATGQSRRRTFLIGALPTSLSYDGSDDLLNPMRGYRLSARVSPEASFQNSAFGYLKAQIDGSAYVPIGGGTSIAGRVRIGSIVGAGLERIAPSRRFYAGGGGSVRGYGYQDIGPRDVDNDPIGGRSLAEFSLEARVRFGNFGVVPFIDGGNLYTTALPKFTGLRYGAGIGARYYTNFGPIRIDVGTPLNPRKGDPRVAVYVSLGQAF